MEANPEKKSRKWIKGCLILLLLTLLSCYILFLNFDRIICGGEFFGDYPSPDGKIILSVSERNCGVTTWFSTVLALRRSWQRWDPHNRNCFFHLEDHPDWLEIEVKWIDNNTIEVQYLDIESRVKYKVDQFEYAGRKIDIIYIIKNK